MIFLSAGVDTLPDILVIWIRIVVRKQTNDSLAKAEPPCEMLSDLPTWKMNGWQERLALEGGRLG